MVSSTNCLLFIAFGGQDKALLSLSNDEHACVVFCFFVYSRCFAQPFQHDLASWSSNWAFVVRPESLRRAV